MPLCNATKTATAIYGRGYHRGAPFTGWVACYESLYRASGGGGGCGESCHLVINGRSFHQAGMDTAGLATSAKAVTPPGGAVYGLGEGL